MKPPLSRACKVNTSDQMFEIRDQEKRRTRPAALHVDAPQEVARMFADLVPLGSRVLDVGCGTEIDCAAEGFHSAPDALI